MWLYHIYSYKLNIDYDLSIKLFDVGNLQASLVGSDNLCTKKHQSS